MSKKLIEVVPPLPQEVAKKAFEQWRLENHTIATKLSAEDIITDYIRASEGRTLVRYRVALEDKVFAITQSPQAHTPSTVC